jgi:hypothetical protein
MSAELFDRFTPVAGLGDKHHIVFSLKHSGDSLA